MTKLSIFTLILTTFFLTSCGEKPRDLAMLMERSRKILQLQSCEYVYRDVVYQGRLEKFLGLITTKETKVLFSVNLRVKAGIDITQQLEITPVVATERDGDPAVRIRVPAAKILSVDSDEHSIHQYFVYEYGLLQEEKVKWLDVQDELTKSREQAKADAIKRGILVKAWENSSTVLRNIFRLAGFKTVIIEPFSDKHLGESAQ